MTPIGFATPVPVRWSDIDMYQHINRATMVTILEEARRLSPAQRDYLDRWVR